MSPSTRFDPQESLRVAIRVRFLSDADAYNGTRLSWLGIDCGRRQCIYVSYKFGDYIHRQCSIGTSLSWLLLSLVSITNK